MSECKNNEASITSFHGALHLLRVNVEQPYVLGVTALVFDRFLSPKCQRFLIPRKGEWTFFIEQLTT